MGDLDGQRRVERVPEGVPVLPVGTRVRGNAFVSEGTHIGLTFLFLFLAEKKTGTRGQVGEGPGGREEQHRGLAQLRGKRADLDRPAIHEGWHGWMVGDDGGVGVPIGWGGEMGVGCFSPAHQR